jgi:hypothetical protein
MEEHDHLLEAKIKMPDMHNGVASHEIFGHLLIVIAEELRVIRKQLGYIIQENRRVKNDNETPEIS